MDASAAIKGRFPGIFHASADAPVSPLGGGPDGALGGGLRMGALHEVFPASSGEEAAASGFALALGHRVLGPRKWLLWVRQDFSALENGDIHAAGLLELGIAPERVLMVRAPDARGALRAAADGLGCAGVGAIILEAWGKPDVFSLLASRKLMLAAQQSGITVIGLHFGMTPHPSAAETRWRISAVPSRPDENWGRPLFNAALVRNRHGGCGQWIMEWDCDNAIFQAHPERLAAAPSHRPSEAAMEGIRQAG